MSYTNYFRNAFLDNVQFLVLTKPVMSLPQRICAYKMCKEARSMKLESMRQIGPVQFKNTCTNPSSVNARQFLWGY